MKPHAAAAALAVALGAGPAAARAESEQALSVSLGWATFSALDPAPQQMEPASLSPAIGGSLGASYERMIGTDFGLRAEVMGGLFYGGGDGSGGSGSGGGRRDDGRSKVSNALLADAGVTLRFDVLKYVPYAFAGIGALTTGGGPLERATDVVLVVGGGLDWLQSRTRSYGAEVRLVSFGADVTVVTIGLRATTRWGFF